MLEFINSVVLDGNDQEGVEAVRGLIEHLLQHIYYLLFPLRVPTLCQGYPIGVKKEQPMDNKSPHASCCYLVIIVYHSVLSICFETHLVLVGDG